MWEGAPQSPPSIRPPAVLYVHVPYCVSVCPYCDFVVVAGSASRGPRSSVQRYLEAVGAELELRADALDERFGPPGTQREAPPGAATRRTSLGSLYFGGGTPSLLPASAVGRLIDIVRRRFGLARDAELTLEVNPRPDERGDAGALRAAGVTRLSIGAQSLDDAELRRLGRRHVAADVAATVAAARATGMASVSLDLLYDAPGQTLDSWAVTLDRALSLEPDHLSLYALTLEDPADEGLTGPLGDHLPPSAGARRWRAAARAAQDDDRAAAMYELADRRLGAAGFEWYEISNWARPGHESRHNLAYWQRRPYEAVGPGAHAFDGLTRRWNAAPLDAYLDALAPYDSSDTHLPPGGRERIDGRVAVAEAAILALRTRDGSVGPTVDDSTRAWVAQRLAPLAAGDLVEQMADGHVLTLRGRLLSNEVFGLLLPDPTH